MLPPSAWSLVEQRSQRLEPSAELTIRRAAPADAPALRALAALDGETPLYGEILVAEGAGGPVAALELSGGRTVADPFLPSASAVALLQVRAGQLRGIAAAKERSPRLHAVRHPLRALTGARP